MPPLHIGHVPTPLSQAGSSIARVIREITRQHSSHGGRTTVAVAANRDLAIEGADNRLVDYLQTCPRQWFNRRETAIDVAVGRLGHTRPYYGRLQRPAMDAFAVAKPDVIVIHEGHYAAASLQLWRKRFSTSLIVLYLHNPLSRSYSRAEVRRLLGAADGLIFVSARARDLEEGRFGPFPVPTSVVHNGVDRDVFRPGPRELEPRGERARQITYVGQVAPHKGVDLLFNAIAASQLRGARIRVIGSGAHDPSHPMTSYEQSLREQARTLGLNVEFTPFSAQTVVAQAYRDSDIVCVPSIWNEPFGMVALEAMASGAAVVASDRGGLPEACGDAATLVDPENLGQFAAALDLHADPEFLHAQRCKSVERASRAGWDETYDQLVTALAGWGK